MSTFAVTFINITGETSTRRIYAETEKQAISTVEKFGYFVKSCIKIN